MEDSDYSIDDPDAFLRRVKNVEYGLSAEVEFAAILRWLGVCRFVHRLNRETLADTGSEWTVPDLLAVFGSGGVRCSAAIEVKTTSDMMLSLKRDYLARLKAYADLVRQPLLLAWRARKVGSWILVDPLVMESDGVLDDKLEYVDAMPYDLMSVLAGDFHVAPKKGRRAVLAGQSGRREASDGRWLRGRVSGRERGNPRRAGTSGKERARRHCLDDLRQSRRAPERDGGRVYAIVRCQRGADQGARHPAYGSEFSIGSKRTDRLEGDWNELGRGFELR